MARISAINDRTYFQDDAKCVRRFAVHGGLRKQRVFDDGLPASCGARTRNVFRSEGRDRLRAKLGERSHKTMEFGTSYKFDDKHINEGHKTANQNKGLRSS